MQGEKILERNQQRLSRLAFVLVAVCLLFSSLRANEISINKELYVELPDMVIPIVQHRDVSGFFAVTLAVDCKNKEVADKLRENQPLLMDRLFWDMYVLLGVIWSPNFRTSLLDMKKRLVKRVETLVGEGEINDVLVLNFQERERLNTDFTYHDDA